MLLCWFCSYSVRTLAQWRILAPWWTYSGWIWWGSSDFKQLAPYFGATRSRRLHWSAGPTSRTAARQLNANTCGKHKRRKAARQGFGLPALSSA